MNHSSTLGQTKYLGQNYAFSYHGHRLSTLKSLLQKTVRRRDVSMAARLSFEVNSFIDLHQEVVCQRAVLEYNLQQDSTNPTVQAEHVKQWLSHSCTQDLLPRIMPKKDSTQSPTFTLVDWVAWLGKRSSKIITSIRNIIHRIMIIAVEDCVDLDLPIDIHDSLAQLIQVEGCAGWQPLFFTTLMRMIHCDKIRLTSDLKVVYRLPVKNKKYSPEAVYKTYHRLKMHPETYGLEPQDVPRIHKVLEKWDQAKDWELELGDQCASYLEKMCIGLPDGYFHFKHLAQEDPELRRMAYGLAWSLLSMSETSFVWVRRMMTATTKTYRSLRPKKHVDHMIWAIIKTVVYILTTSWRDDFKGMLPHQKRASANLLRTVEVLHTWFVYGNFQSKGVKAYELPEANLFIYMAMVYVVFLERLQPRTSSSLTCMDDLPKSVQDCYAIHSTQGLLLQDMPSYAMDMHDKRSTMDVRKKIQRFTSQLGSKAGFEGMENKAELWDFLDTYASSKDLYRNMRLHCSNSEHWIQYLQLETRDASHYACIASRVEDEQTQLLQPDYRLLYVTLKGALIKEKIQRDLENQYGEASLAPVPKEVQDVSTQTSRIELKDITEMLEEASGLAPDSYREALQLSASSYDAFAELFSSSGPLRSTRILRWTPFQLTCLKTWGIQAQKRCGHQKIPVALCRDHVVKGPYKLSQPGHKQKFLLNLCNLGALTYLEKHIQCPTKNMSSLAIDYIVQPEAEQDHAYLVYRNMGDVSTTILSKEEADTSIEQGKRVARPGSCVVSLGEYLKKKSCTHKPGHDEADTSVLSSALQHLYFRYCLNMGDSNPRNILVVKSPELVDRHCVGIDMEEIRRAAPHPDASPMGLMLGGSRPTPRLEKKSAAYLETHVDCIQRLSTYHEHWSSLLECLGRLYWCCDASFSPTQFKERVDMFNLACQSF